MSGDADNFDILVSKLWDWAVSCVWLPSTYVLWSIWSKVNFDFRLVCSSWLILGKEPGVVFGFLRIIWTGWEYGYNETYGFESDFKLNNEMSSVDDLNGKVVIDSVVEELSVTENLMESSVLTLDFGEGVDSTNPWFLSYESGVYWELILSLIKFYSHLNYNKLM